MAQTLKEWLSTEVKKLQKMPVSELSNTFFFRDPIRPNFIDHEHFYSPADGTILYQKFITDPTEPVVEIKGMNYTLQDVVGDDEYNTPSLVIGIFMSFYDVHIILHTSIITSIWFLETQFQQHSNIFAWVVGITIRIMTYFIIAIRAEVSADSIVTS